MLFVRAGTSQTERHRHSLLMLSSRPQMNGRVVSQLAAKMARSSGERSLEWQQVRALLPLGPRALWSRRACRMCMRA